MTNVSDIENSWLQFCLRFQPYSSIIPNFKSKLDFLKSFFINNTQ